MSSGEDFEEEMSNAKVGRRTYLITYSNADVDKFPTRKGFGEMIQKYFDASFNAGKSATKTVYFACAQEKHANGAPHYHVSLKLSNVKKWAEVKRSIQKNEGIVLNFSDKHGYYVAAYRYICKEDNAVYTSPGHPKHDEIASPATKKCSAVYRKKRRSYESATASATSSGGATGSDTPRRDSSTPKPKRICNLDVAEFVLKNRISNVTELFAVANTRKQDGERDLARFVLNKTDKQLEEVIEKAYRLTNAGHELTRQNSSRFEILKQKSEGECVESCDKLWLTSALEVLEKNKIHPVLYANAVRELLVQGRGKWRNLYIMGNANCAKTFMLKPLEDIYKCFCNPAKDKYAWVGADEAEIILLQDFRWDSETIAWKCLLLLLEGETVKLPAPKNHFARDVVISGDVPIFATSKDRIKYLGPNNALDEREDKMMDCRWKVFHFTYEFPEEEQKQIKPCGRCFAELALTGHIE